jgi:PAS domain S-box-containing protein
LVLCTNWLFRLPVNKANDLKVRFAFTKSQIADLKAIQSEFLLSFNQTDNLISTIDNKAEENARSIIASIKRDLTIYIANYPLARKAGVSSSLEDFSASLSSFENHLNDFFLISHERGNLKSGLVSKWVNVTKVMLSMPDLPEGGLKQKLTQIKQLESEYLLSRDIRVLENISLIAEEIRNQIAFEEGVITYQDLDTYMALTGNLASVEKRTGRVGAAGILPSLENSLQKLQADFDKANKSLVSSITKSRIWWTSARYFFILLLVAIYIYLFIHVFSIVDPLKQLAGFTQKMAKGEFPDDSIACGNLPDMHTIKESLEMHVSSLRDKLAFAGAINQDTLNSDLKLLGENDLLGNELLQLQKKIVETAEKQAVNDEENLKRRYMNEGLAKFGDILRTKSNDLSSLGDAFIREIVKYLNGIQGGFFVYDETDKSAPVLNLISAFAYNRKKYLHKSIALGEGLVGTCAKEKKSINLLEIPSGYISITSGLGDTTPDNLLLVPVLHENELLGVLEIASLHKFRPHEIEFAEEVTLNLGSTIDYTRNNQKTAELLAKSQQQALEMAEQEEEMRQNMEELKATQEESGRREEEFRGIVEAIENTLFVIEYDLEGIIREANNKLCSLLGVNRDDVIGKLHQEVFNGNLKTDSQFWEEIQHNGHKDVKETIRVGKKSFTLLEHFNTIVNRDGIPVKYINFATDDRIGNS